MGRPDKKQERLGEIKENKEHLGKYKMKIIKYNGKDDIIIEFQDEYKARVHTQYGNFKKGNVKNPYHPSVYGVGYLGEGKYKPSENGKSTKIYEVWVSMLQRCYDPYFLNKRPTYRDCMVCNEWHNFQNFAKWWEEKLYECNNERMELDKDILVKGNKIYSPETCLIVPNRINLLFCKRQNRRGKYPIGVTDTIKNIDNKTYLYLIVSCSILYGEKCKIKHLGNFPLNRPFQAFTVYKNFKESYIKQIADEYKNFIPTKLYSALYRYEVEIND